MHVNMSMVCYLAMIFLFFFYKEHDLGDYGTAGYFNQI